MLAWDELAQGVVTLAPPPWHADDAPGRAATEAEGDAGGERGARDGRVTPWRDSDGVRAQAWLQRAYGLRLSARDAYLAALVVAEAARHDPLVTWLRGLRWDGQSRAERWLSTYLGAEDTDYTRFVGKAFLVSAVARALVPGCKVDTMLVLEGAQGLAKSASLKALFGAQWTSDTPLELSSKDRFVGLRGVWLHEMAELDSLGKSDAARFKNFLSSAADDYRPPYAQSSVRVPRRVVFAGTVNPGPLGYLRDETGNRRLWPVACGLTRAVGPEAAEELARDRALIWAEAREMYGMGPRAGGEKWWPVTPEERAMCAGEQEARELGDVWLGRVESWLAVNRAGADRQVTIREVLSDGLGVEVARQGRTEQTRVGVVLHQLGWEVVRRAGGGSRERFYARRRVASAGEHGS